MLFVKRHVNGVSQPSKKMTLTDLIYAIDQKDSAKVTTYLNDDPDTFKTLVANSIDIKLPLIILIVDKLSFEFPSWGEILVTMVKLGISIEMIYPATEEPLLRVIARRVLPSVYQQLVELAVSAKSNNNHTHAGQPITWRARFLTEFGELPLPNASDDEYKSFYQTTQAELDVLVKLSEKIMYAAKNGLYVLLAALIPKTELIPQKRFARITDTEFPLKLRWQALCAACANNHLEAVRILLETVSNSFDMLLAWPDMLLRQNFTELDLSVSPLDIAKNNRNPDIQILLVNKMRFKLTDKKVHSLLYWLVDLDCHQAIGSYLISGQGLAILNENDKLIALDLAFHKRSFLAVYSMLQVDVHFRYLIHDLRKEQFCNLIFARIDSIEDMTALSQVEQEVRDYERFFGSSRFKSTHDKRKWRLISLTFLEKAIQIAEALPIEMGDSDPVLTKIFAQYDSSNMSMEWCLAKQRNNHQPYRRVMRFQLSRNYGNNHVRNCKTKLEDNPPPQVEHYFSADKIVRSAENNASCFTSSKAILDTITSYQEKFAYALQHNMREELLNFLSEDISVQTDITNDTLKILLCLSLQQSDYKLIYALCKYIAIDDLVVYCMTCASDPVLIVAHIIALASKANHYGLIQGIFKVISPLQFFVGVSNQQQTLSHHCAELIGTSSLNQLIITILEVLKLYLNYPGDSILPLAAELGLVDLIKNLFARQISRLESNSDVIKQAFLAAIRYKYSDIVDCFITNSPCCRNLIKHNEIPNLPLYLYDEIMEVKDLESLQQVITKYETGIYKKFFRDIAVTDNTSFFKGGSLNLLSHFKLMSQEHQRTLSERVHITAEQSQQPIVKSPLKWAAPKP